MGTDKIIIEPRTADKKLSVERIGVDPLVIEAGKCKTLNDLYNFYFRYHKDQGTCTQEEVQTWLKENGL